VQVDTIKPTLKAPGTKRLKLKYVGSLSNVALNINLRRYMTDCDHECDLAEPEAGAYTRPLLTQAELFLTQNTPKHPLLPLNTSSTPPQPSPHAPPILQTALPLTSKVNECNPLAGGVRRRLQRRPARQRHGLGRQERRSRHRGMVIHSSTFSST